MHTTSTFGHGNALASSVLPMVTRQRNPWVTDELLLNLSVWFVKATRPQANDIGAEVAAVFGDLQHRLQ